MNRTIPAVGHVPSQGHRPIDVTHSIAHQPILGPHTPLPCALCIFLSNYSKSPDVWPRVEDCSGLLHLRNEKENAVVKDGVTTNPSQPASQRTNPRQIISCCRGCLQHGVGYKGKQHARCHEKGKCSKASCNKGENGKKWVAVRLQDDKASRRCICAQDRDHTGGRR